MYKRQYFSFLSVFFLYTLLCAQEQKSFDSHSGVKTIIEHPLDSVGRIRHKTVLKTTLSTVRVEPETIRIKMFTGQQTTQHLNIKNQGNSSLQFSVQFQDSSRFNTGTLYTFNSNTLPDAFQLLGTAELIYPPGEIVLTTDTYDQLGGLFTATPIQSSHFTIDFDFRIIGSGADGLCLAFLENTTLGTGGGGLGLLSPDNKGWALEFDTWYNGDHDDQSDNHASLVTSDLDVLASNNDVPPFENNGWFHCELQFRNGYVNVFLENNSINYPKTNILSHSFADGASFKGYIGFMGATGGAMETHIVDNVKISLSDSTLIQPNNGVLQPNDSITIAVALSAEGLRGGEYLNQLIINTNSVPDSVTIVPIQMTVESAPDISIQSVSDFGRIIKGTKEIEYIAIRNVGFQDLTVTNVRSTRGLTRPLLLSFIVRSKETINVPAEIIGSTKGLMIDTLMINSNDPDEGTFLLQVKALIVDSPNPLISGIISSVSDTSLSRYVRGLEAFGTRDAKNTNRDSVVQWIRQAFTDAGIADVRLDTFLMDMTVQTNVVATIEGSSPQKEEIVVGAHYDSYSYSGLLTAPGADDNASGTSAVLEIARVLSTEHYKPHATIRFVAFAAEEYGLCGSEHYAKEAFESRSNIILMHNFDMIGYHSANNGVYVIKYQNGEFEARLDSSLMAMYTNLRPTISTIYNSQSDSWPFGYRRYPTVFNIEKNFSPYYHSSNDSSCYVDFQYIADIVKSGIALLLTTDDMITKEKHTFEIVPSNFTLTQNFPNPFNPSTTIRYALPNSAKVRLTVYDFLGREIETLVDEEQSAGWKEVKWNASSYASGVYLVRMQCGNPSTSSGQVFVETKKLLFLK